MPTVCNRRANTTIPPTPGAIYVGRGTVYGNPFFITDYGSVQAVIERYRTWIYQPEQAFLRKQMERELRGKDLVCWCAPRICHADIIMEIANQDSKPRKHHQLRSDGRRRSK